LALASAGCSATGLLFLSDAAAEFESAVAGPVEPSIATLDERPIQEGFMSSRQLQLTRTSG